jgi:protein O-GlcNAc transferase
LPPSYPGTSSGAASGQLSGVSWNDGGRLYRFIADEIVLPFDQQPFYSECIIRLPDCYQPNDRRRQIADCTPGRVEVGLPEQGVVFCSFNNNWKITPEVFDVWMRLLNGIDGSVLWLLRGNTASEQNLKKEAVTRGVDPGRLVFAPHMKLEDHLARHRLADPRYAAFQCTYDGERCAVGGTI